MSRPTDHTNHEDLWPSLSFDSWVTSARLGQGLAMPDAGDVGDPMDAFEDAGRWAVQCACLTAVIPPRQGLVLCPTCDDAKWRPVRYPAD